MPVRELTTKVASALRLCLVYGQADESNTMAHTFRPASSFGRQVVASSEPHAAGTSVAVAFKASAAASSFAPFFARGLHTCSVHPLDIILVPAQTRAWCQAARDTVCWQSVYSPEPTSLRRLGAGQVQHLNNNAVLRRLAANAEENEQTAQQCTLSAKRLSRCFARSSVILPALLPLGPILITSIVTLQKANLC